MSDPIAIQTLKAHDIKATLPRILILKYVVGNETHPTAEDVFNKIHEEESSISLATIYNTLETFVKKGILQKINSFCDKVHYDSNMDLHFHLICQKCKKVYDIKRYDSIKFQIKKELFKKYDIDKMQVCFQGCCTDCKKLNSKKDQS